MSSRISQKQYYNLVNSTENLSHDSSEEVGQYEARQQYDDNGKTKKKGSISKTFLLNEDCLGVMAIQAAIIIIEYFILSYIVSQMINVYLYPLDFCSTKSYCPLRLRSTDHNNWH